MLEEFILDLNNLDKIYDSDPSIFSKHYFDYLTKIFSKIDHSDVAKLISSLIDARDNDASIFFIANGGSASTASHFANDIAIGSKATNKPFKAFSLTDNQAIITAISNDFGYQKVFVNQLKVFASPGDLLVAISASGNSKNLIEAIEYSNENKINTFSITAFDGGIIKKIANNNIHIKTEMKEYGPAEDIHMILVGLIGSYLVRYVASED